MATESAQKTLLNLKEDLKFQLGTIDDLDWDYFLETAIKAKIEADKAQVNMPEIVRELSEIIKDARESTE